MTSAPANWQEELRVLLLELGPGVFVAEVRHDDWCAFLNARGPCNCNPDIEIQRVKEPPAAKSRRRAEVGE